MSDTTGRGGFTGDPAAALTVAGSSGCCGNPARTTNITLPENDAPCCGTPAEAQASGSCCGTTAKADAVASGTGCCG
jgi:hypothetical protein